MHGKIFLKKGNMENSGKKTLNPALLLFLVILVVAVSGCISSLGLGPQQKTVEAPNDVMSFSDSTVIPNPPILTGDTFTTSFAMKNLDEFEDAKNVRLELYDWGACTPSSCSPPKKDNIGWDAIDKTKLQTSYSASFNDISPNDVQQVECQFRAPSSEKIGGIDARCPVRYKLTYDFSGITTTDLNVISNKKFQEMSRAGQTPSATSTQSKSRGPIKVDFSFGVNQPARTSATGNPVKIPMYIRVENKGSGKAIFVTSLNLIVNDKSATFNNAGDVIDMKNFKLKLDGYSLKLNAISYKKDSANFQIINPSGKIETDFFLGLKDSGYPITKDIVVNGEKLTFKFDSVIGNNLQVKIPNDLIAGDCSKYKCDSFIGSPEIVDGKETNNCILTFTSGSDRTQPIEFVKDKSQVFRCELTSPSDTVVPEQKTYSIQSEVKYTYQLDNDFSVAIKPMTTG